MAAVTVFSIWERFLLLGARRNLQSLTAEVAVALGGCGSFPCQAPALLQLQVRVCSLWM